MKNTSLQLPLLLVVAALVCCLPTSGAELPGWAKPRLQRLLRGGARSAAAHGRRWLMVEVTVAKNGNGDYRTIAAALAAAPKSTKKVRSSYTIRIGEGMYIEQLNITRRDVTLFGDGVGKTVITGNRGSLKHGDMPSSATVSK